MIRRPPRSTRTDTLFPYTTLFRSVDLAAVAFVLAAIRPDDIILEPSAGNGLLVAHCRDHAGLQLNEYAAPRRARLAHAFPDALVTGHDGATINSTLADAPKSEERRVGKECVRTCRSRW